jgi:RNA polymerase sigma-70 factor, ECF subfamily
MPSSPVHETNNPDVSTAAFDNPGTDEELVAAAKSGDELAFEMLIKRNQSRIFTLALRYTRVHEDAEDIVQQTFQKAFVYLHKFKGKSSFSTWVTRIAINESLMFLRRGRTVREISIDETDRAEGTCDRDIGDSRLDPEVSYLQRESAQILSSAMAQLRPGTRVAMELRDLRELSAPETARELGVSLSTIKARVFSGRRKLREILRRSNRSPRRSGRTILALAGSVSADRKIA